MKVFNKVQSDFETLEQYNNYLEEVEDISKFIFIKLFDEKTQPNQAVLFLTLLFHGLFFTFFLLSHQFLTVFSIVNEEPNAEECKAKIRTYEEENKAQIVIRQSQRADEERSIQDRIAAEQREVERRKREVREEEKAIALTKRKFKQESTEVLLGVSTFPFDPLWLFIF